MHISLSESSPASSEQTLSWAFLLLGLCSHPLLHLPQFLPILISYPALPTDFGPPFKRSSLQGPLPEHNNLSPLQTGEHPHSFLCPAPQHLPYQSGSANTPWTDCLSLSLHLLPPRSGSAPCPGLYLSQPVAVVSGLVLDLVPTLILALTCLKLWL